MKLIKYLALALLIVPALILLAFGPGSDAPAPEGFTVVDYWEKWTTEEEAAMRVIVNDFNNTVGKDKKIFVRYVSTSNVNQKTLVATAAGVPPDVAGLWDTNLAQFASQEALMPLDDFAAHADPPITAATYKPVFWKACHFNGHLYALISTPMSTAMMYNTDEFREAGLDPNHPPETMDEFDHDAQLIDKRDDQGRIVRTGFMPTVPGWYVNFSYLWFGGDIWDAKHQKFTLTDPRVVKSFEWIQSYPKRLGKDAVNEFQSAAGNFDSPQNPWLAGTICMTQQGPWMAFYVLNLKPSMAGLRQRSEDNIELPLETRRAKMHWAAAAFPSAVPGQKDVTLCQFDTLVIPRGSKHPKEAFEFIAYVNRQEVMEKLCNTTCKNSPLAKVSDRFLQHHNNPYIDVFERLANSPNAHGTPQIPIFPEVNDELTVLVQRLTLQPTAEPRTELEQLQERLQKKYDAYMDIQRARELVARQ